MEEAAEELQRSEAVVDELRRKRVLTPPSELASENELL